jgi:hypothetical protein
MRESDLEGGRGTGEGGGGTRSGREENFSQSRRRTERHPSVLYSKSSRPFSRTFIFVSLTRSPPSPPAPFLILSLSSSPTPQSWRNDYLFKLLPPLSISAPLSCPTPLPHPPSPSHSRRRARRLRPSTRTRAPPSTRQSSAPSCAPWAR